MQLRILDLFSGMEGWSMPFVGRGHDVVTLDLNTRFNADFQIDFIQVKDLMTLERSGRFHMVIASPPCESFSTGSFRYHHEAIVGCSCGQMAKRLSGEKWSHSGPGHKINRANVTFAPKSDTGRIGLALLQHTFDLIRLYQPDFWLVENPRAMARNYVSLIAPAAERRTVTWCQYGDNCMKPTDLWGGFPTTFTARSCKNGASCHEAAPRGARTGTQGKKDAAARGKIPYGLALEVCKALEKEYP